VEANPDSLTGQYLSRARSPSARLAAGKATNEGKKLALSAKPRRRQAAREPAAASRDLQESARHATGNNLKDVTVEPSRSAC
jgi:hypothetical protein